jgi:hypothetical protein
MKMELDHDPEVDALYITLRSDLPFKTCVIMDDARVIDFAPGPVPIGIELLGVSRGIDVRGLPEEQAVAALLRQAGFTIRAASAEVAEGKDHNHLLILEHEARIEAMAGTFVHLPRGMVHAFLCA